MLKSYRSKKMSQPNIFAIMKTNTNMIFEVVPGECITKASWKMKMNVVKKTNLHVVAKEKNVKKLTKKRRKK